MGGPGSGRYKKGTKLSTTKDDLRKKKQKPTPAGRKGGLWVPTNNNVPMKKKRGR